MKIIACTTALALLGSLGIGFKAEAQSCECRPGLRYVPGRAYSSYVNVSCAYRVCTGGGSEPSATSTASPSGPSPTFTTSNPSSLSSDVSFPVSEGLLAAVETNGSVLNVRSGSGLDNPVIFTLENQVEVRLAGSEDKGWVEISEGAWVHSDYLNPLPE